MPDKFSDLRAGKAGISSTSRRPTAARRGAALPMMLRAWLAGTEEPTVLILDVDPDTFAELPDAA